MRELTMGSLFDGIGGFALSQALPAAVTAAVVFYRQFEVFHKDSVSLSIY